MSLTRTNYFDRVKSVNFATLPKPLQEGHDFTKRVGEVSNWAMYDKSPAIQRTVDLYFEKLDAYLAQQAPKPVAKPKKDTLADRYTDSPIAKAQAQKERDKAAAKPAPAAHAGPPLYYYEVLYMSKKVRVKASSLYTAKQEGTRLMNIPSKKEHMAHAHLLTEDDGTPARADAPAPSSDAKPRKKLPMVKPPKGRAGKPLKRKAVVAQPSAPPKKNATKKLQSGARVKVGDRVKYTGKIAQDKPVIDKRGQVTEVNPFHNDGTGQRDYLITIQFDNGGTIGKLNSDKGLRKDTSTAEPKPADNGPKRTKVKAHKNQNLRQPVSHYDGDQTLLRQFLSFVDKKGSVTRKQVKALHAKMEKAIIGRKVRKTSPNADLLRDAAKLVSKSYEYMVQADVDTLTVKLSAPAQQTVTQARAAVDVVAIRPAVPLLARFINLQGTKPEAKTVSTLLKSVEKAVRDQPADDYAGPLKAAMALLRDWKPGTAVRITTQQLSGLQGLAGLGCPCEEAGK